MLETFVGLLGTATFAIFGWAFHLNTRVSVVEAQRDDLKELLETKFDEVGRRLDRIERSMNGHLLKE